MLDAGSFKLRTGLLEVIAGIALSGVEGAWGMGVRCDHPDDLKKRKNLAKGIRVEVEEGKVTVDLDVNMDYGRDFQDTARRVQEGVREAIEGMTGWEVEAVNVNVVGVSAP